MKTQLSARSKRTCEWRGSATTFAQNLEALREDDSRAEERLSASSGGWSFLGLGAVLTAGGFWWLGSVGIIPGLLAAATGLAFVIGGVRGASTNLDDRKLSVLGAVVDAIRLLSPTESNGHLKVDFQQARLRHRGKPAIHRDNETEVWVSTSKHPWLFSAFRVGQARVEVEVETEVERESRFERTGIRPIVRQRELVRVAIDGLSPDPVPNVGGRAVPLSNEFVDGRRLVAWCVNETEEHGLVDGPLLARIVWASLGLERGAAISK